MTKTMEGTGTRQAPAASGGNGATALPSSSAPPGPSVSVTTAHFARRTVLKDASFFVDHLRPGMRLLDCGCGPGTISAGLAELVAPGELVGIDKNDRHLELARTHAAERGLNNVRFEHADLFDLPFDAASFDAAFVSRVLEHLRDPVAAMREVHRVLKPGGVVGVISPDYGGTIIAPIDPLLELWVTLHRKQREAYGGNPLMGRFLRATLLEAGFVRVVGAVSAECYADAEATRTAASGAAQYAEEEWGRAVVENGFTDHTTVMRIAAAWRAWGERPDAFYATPHGAAVGWTASADELQS